MLHAKYKKEPKMYEKVGYYFRKMTTSDFAIKTRIDFNLNK